MPAVERAPQLALSVGAFGMNTGVCDAHNLAWKLAAVIQGRASDALLDTYTGEDDREHVMLLRPARAF